MDDARTKEQLLHELIQMQKEIEKKVETQERFIARFQFLTQHEGLFSKVIDNLPFPIAIFELSGIVRVANALLMTQANITANDLSGGNINILDRVTNENYAVFEAVEDAVCGQTTVVGNLVLPLALFCTNEYGVQDDPYRAAIFFPVPANGGTRYGAVMFMREPLSLSEKSI